MAFTSAQVEQLLRPVNPRRVQRDNHGMSHLAAYDVSAHLTRIFGFGGWSKHILSLDLVAEDGIVDANRNRIGWYVTYRCTMRLEVGDWANEDGATGSASNLPDRGDAHDFALKNAISYALKRCAKDLGDQFGLSLYNKGSTAALIGRTLVNAAGDRPPGLVKVTPAPDVDAGVPDLAPDWDEQPPGREDGLPTNRDGSLSRSRTTDAEKDAAGVMTAAQQAEHTALQPKAAETRGKVTRIRADGAPAPTGPGNAPAMAAGADPWIDQPAGSLDILPEAEDRPGTITPWQQRAMHAAFKGMDRAARLARISEIIGRPVTSSNELSYREAAKVLPELRKAMT